ncbi:hypothetical protein D8674_033904 [Pyrus ussuriensis x Pyrus communis]|uniref:Aminotransferase-like plant mobile domain-containing protein n=1 Tax=Pyrus ussuriensis x Pyrus communis TaxID=2448454 RepID=A0A5N5HME6_9ROSA|nr:hypothetical protein D8674_033904 [Pyrus ussuriensis x Pyrus communis]
MKDEGWTQWINELEHIFKRKWMNNGIYELIMLSKTIVIAKLELLTTALIIWNSGTNTFDFRMSPMSPTILDMAQVFGLRPSGRVVDVTHDWSLPSHLSAKSSSTSNPITQLDYNFSTFKSYGTLFTGFIPFEHMYFLLYWLNKHVFPNKSMGVKVEWIPLVEALHNFDDVVDVGLDKEAGDAFILQEAEAEAVRQGAGEGRDVFKLFGDSEGEVEPVVETRATRRTRAMSSTAPPVEAGKKKQKASRPRTTKKPIFMLREEPLVFPSLIFFFINSLPDCLKQAIREEKFSPPKASLPLARTAYASPHRARFSKFDPTIEEMLHFVEDNKSHILATSVFGEPIVLEIFVVLEVTSLRASPQIADSGNSPPPLVSLAVEEMIKVVTFEIQKLDDKLYQQIEEVKKANLEMEDAKSQLANNGHCNLYME